MPSNTQKPAGILGIATNGTDKFRIQLIDANGNGRSIWWELDAEKAKLLAAGLDVFLSRPKVSGYEDERDG